MADIRFGRLVDLPLRDAWKHEAREFTPWLAANIDHLSDAIGVPLEMTGTEVAVEAFSADILARNTSDGTVVLIENQLETTNHTHLGQIMTYLAGLEAQTVVWIAPAFREPHLSAIRWLNENTSNGFSFFAVKARVVRIGDSPFAPIFEVVEQPSDWDRALTATRREATANRDPLSDTRLGFWTYYCERRPEAVAAGLKPNRAWNVYFPVGDQAALLSLFIAQKYVGAYLRPGWNGDTAALQSLLAPHAQTLEERLGAELGPRRDHFLSRREPLDYSDRAQWDSIINWMEAMRTAYSSAMATVVGDIG